jgi:hypothetical protein
MSEDESKYEFFDEKKLLHDVKLEIDQYLKESFQTVLNDLNNGSLKIIRNKYDNEDLLQNGGSKTNRSNTYRSKTNRSKSKTNRSKSKTNRSKSKNILPPISKSKEDSLSKYGYKLSKSPLARRRALKKAARSRGTLTVLKRVNLIGNYSKSVPVNYDKLRADVEFLKDEYAKEKIEKIRAIYAPKLKRSKSKTKTFPKII